MTQSMYQDHFGISENPFSIIPDPRYLYMSQRHQDALAHLVYGVSESGGFVLLTGEVGTGKTTLCRALMEKTPDNTDLALILNPKLNEAELMATICDEMRISYPLGTSSLKSFFDYLTHHLLHAHARGRNPVLLIDEAQNLTPAVLELIRLLTNLETADKKLLQIVLVGQPELNAILSRDDMRQTNQRITARYHLEPLGLSETQSYIQHRLKVAGLDEQVLSAASIKAVFDISGGIPRLINSVCDRALLGAYVEGKMHVDVDIIRRAAKEVLGYDDMAQNRNWWGSAILAIVLAGSIAFLSVDPYGLRILDKASTFIDAHMAPSAPIIEPQNKPEPEPQPKPKPAPKPEPEPTPDPEPVLPDAPLSIVPAEDALIGDLAQAGSQDRAFVKLFKLWKLDYLKLNGTTPCEKATAAKLSCLQGRTDLQGLKAINRPTAVSFSTVADERIYGVLRSIETGVETETTEIDFIERRISVPLETFALRWPGDFMVLWMPHDIINRPLQLGNQGADVVELRRILVKAGLLPTTEAEDPIFDAQLRDSVRAVQVDHGLEPTGILDPITLMRLSGLVDETYNPPMTSTAPKEP
ncbi:AAA family ATPase [Magnetovibrio sp. PR-2]|uniref:AAA family ATPase n=1 Tax=Magnetovibrio sp. PR-2 TaxID=3120356 RepID=UPI002FCE08F4